MGGAMNRVMQVESRVGYRIWLRYADGASGEVDLSDMAGKGVFRSWRDPGFFAGVHVAPHGAVAWSDEIELCADALYLELTGQPSGRLLSGLRSEAAAHA